MSSEATNRTGDEWPDRWFVTNGVVAVGPVSFGFLLRGVALGRIPHGSVVRHESWRVWRNLEDIGALSGNGRQQTVEDLASLSSSLELHASGLSREAPPPPSVQELRASLQPAASMESPPSAIRSAGVDLVGEFEHAGELTQALLLTLSTAAAAASAEVGLVHRPRRDLGRVVCVGGHGSRTECLLGERLSEDDPTIAAAYAGHTVLSEPEFGENSRYLLGRLRRCLDGAHAAAMVPVLLYGDLVAVFEFGRRGSPFRAREIARAEDVIDALAGRCDVMGWI